MVQWRVVVSSIGRLSNLSRTHTQMKTEIRTNLTSAFVVLPLLFSILFFFLNICVLTFNFGQGWQSDSLA